MPEDILQTECQVQTTFRYRCLGGLMVFLVCFCSSARGVEDPKAVVLRFCELDGTAARMSSTLPESPKLWALTAGEGEPPAEPILIISGCQAAIISGDSSHADVRVTYQVTGQMEPVEFGFALIRKRQDETVVFSLKRTAAGWRILRSSLSFPPHVTEPGIRRYFRARIREKSISEQQKRNLMDILKQLAPAWPG